jgi:hypothetical protein
MTTNILSGPPAVETGAVSVAASNPRTAGGPSQRWIDAAHEAAHGVAAFILADVRSDLAIGPTGGLCFNAPPPRLAWALAVCIAAGAEGSRLAESVEAPDVEVHDVPMPGSHTMTIQAWRERLAAEITSSIPDADALAQSTIAGWYADKPSTWVRRHRRFRAAARLLIRENRDAVLAVAAELFKHGAAGGDTVAMIINNTPQEKRMKTQNTPTPAPDGEGCFQIVDTRAVELAAEAGRRDGLTDLATAVWSGRSAAEIALAGRRNALTPDEINAACRIIADAQTAISRAPILAEADAALAAAGSQIDKLNSERDAFLQEWAARYNPVEWRYREARIQARSIAAGTPDLRKLHVDNPVLIPRDRLPPAMAAALDREDRLARLNAAVETARLELERLTQEVGHRQTEIDNLNRRAADRIGSSPWGVTVAEDPAFRMRMQPLQERLAYAASQRDEAQKRYTETAAAVAAL